MVYFKELLFKSVAYWSKFICFVISRACGSTYGSVSCTMYTADKTACAEQATDWFQITNNEWDPVQNGRDFNLECNCCDQLVLQKTTTYR